MLVGVVEVVELKSVAVKAVIVVALIVTEVVVNLLNSTVGLVVTVVMFSSCVSGSCSNSSTNGARNCIFVIFLFFQLLQEQEMRHRGSRRVKNLRLGETQSDLLRS